MMQITEARTQSVATPAPPLRLGEGVAVRLLRMGPERQPLVVADDVLADPDAMIEAARRARFYAPTHTRYPGLNAPLPESYYRTVVAALRGVFEAAFGLPRDAGLNLFGYFGLATTSARDAEPIQKLPHIDGPEPGRLAMVHYLRRGETAGTGFFRHGPTGFQSIDASRLDAYGAHVARALARGGGQGGYASDALADYALVEAVEPVFNRLIVYRGNVLHSALLGEGGGDADPALGRLTANGFVEPARSG